jgi:hypothetical protein
MLNIETRGERHHNKIYFKLKDIAAAFGMKNLGIYIYNKEGNYVKNIDYKIFICKTNRLLVSSQGISNNIEANIKALFLTYNGLLRVIFSSQSKSAHAYQQWASNILYTVQMGTSEQREELAAECLSVEVQAIREVFNASATEFPCVYFIKFGTAKELRTAFKIPENITDDLIIYKFGNTKNFKKRFAEHENEYGIPLKLNLELVCFTYIDAKNKFKAETSIAHHFSLIDKRLIIDGHDEFIAIQNTTTNITAVKEFYERVFRDFAGATTDLQTQNKDLQTKIDIMIEKHKCEILECKQELLLYKLKINGIN